ncbi:stage V sporulation protein T [Clostridium botulinum]|jgi:AbrB family transcriptional regulator (stage V sporulation protein T)|uniref:Stage V sporulation protein T n=4 Tax=Clostridium TaxID=1485 RepID=A0A2K9MVT8_CLOSG|nr:MULTISPECIES: stage V sporulation protein T [Clostridium]MBE6079137.1 stage V sporulation protein T [Clostridium lundense]AUM97320.1 stage V sporulation protein T [Clostridium sporogenes]AVQ39940.1 stage V sporulation protein T [Clostridium botulinum]AVQ46264.1 stage V sporulation protein T [Clostridium botulinum]AVQ50411.1 stage V sporulation protein T [Clostridium botulinum]
MKATGIVRRIDDLGRVVIPKEIRRTLRIREGDPLEIFTDREGGVILKKYSPIGDLSEFSKGYTDSLQQTIGNIVMICDKDTIISISGAPKKEYLEKKISYDLEKIIEERKTVYFGDDNKAVSIYDDEDIDEKYSAQVISPIIAEGDTVGAVIIVSKEGGKKFNELEMKLAETASSFLGKQMEE